MIKAGGNNMDDNKLNRKVNILIVIGIIEAIAIVALLLRSFTFTPNITPIVSRFEATVDGPDLIIELALNNYDPSLDYAITVSKDVDTTVTKKLDCNEGLCQVNLGHLTYDNVLSEYDIFIRTSKLFTDSNTYVGHLSVDYWSGSTQFSIIDPT